MSEPLPGDIGCTSIEGDVGWLIRLGERLNGDRFAQYQHAFVSIGGGQIVEAEPGGARIADLAEYDARTVVWVRCPDEHRQAVADAAKALVGRPYGFLDYLVIALHRFHVPFPGVRRFAESDKTIICSELGVLAARRGGWALLEPTPAGFVTPAELAALAEPPA